MSNPRQRPLLAILADGQFHSGQELSEQLSLSHGSVWKCVQSLANLGLDVHTVPGKGCRLPLALELLDPIALQRAMEPTTRALLTELEIYLQLDSTNTHVLQKAANGSDSGLACFAECQRAGRGRRDRTWVSPPGGNIYLSVLWRFDWEPITLTGLSLAMGVAGLRAVRELGIEGCGLKWPNDLLWNQRKLGGILIEFSGQTSGPCAVVVGFGLNGRMLTPAASQIDQPWVDLFSILRAPAPRNRLAGRLLHHLLDSLKTFQSQGLIPFLTEFRDQDLLQGKTVVVRQPGEEVTGIACGVDSSGALRVFRHGKIQHYNSGEVSIRFAV